MKNELETQLKTTFRTIDEQRSSFLERLLNYLRMPSISAYGTGMDKVADYLLDWLKNIGMETRLIPTLGWPVVWGRWNGKPGTPTILFYGHYDVQPPDPLEAWISPPFEPSIRNGRIYARGAGDNKGQHFAQILAIETLMKTQGTLPCNVLVVLEGEEETGSPNMLRFVEENRSLLEADLVIVSDGPVDKSGRSTLEFGVRGVASFELHARGANQDVHSGNWGGIVPNPLWELVHLLATMKNEKGEITIAGFYDNVAPPTPQELAALERLPVDVEEIKKELGLFQLDTPLDRPYYERLTFWPTLTINGIHGGYGGPGSKTVLPHEATAKCDIRLVEAQSVKEILDKVEAHVNQHAPQIKVVRQGGMDPSKTPLDSIYGEPLFQAICTAQGEEPLVMPLMGGSLPNYVFTKNLGLPTFVVPYANSDEANHAPNENIEVERFFKGIKTGAAMMMAIGDL